MFYETFVCFYVREAVFVHKCLIVLNDVEYTTFKMFVTQMSNYLFLISFHLMFYKTLRCSLARPLQNSFLFQKLTKYMRIRMSQNMIPS